MATSPQSLLHNSKDITISNFIRSTALLIISMIIFLSTTLLIATNLNFNVINSVPSKTLSLINACRNAHDLESCVAIASRRNTQALDFNELTIFLQHSIYDIKSAITLAKNVKSRSLNTKNNATIDICVHLLDMSMDRLVDSIAVLSNGPHLDSITYSDVLTWLSGVLTNHDTCLEGLKQGPRLELESRINDLMTRARVSLAILHSLSPNKFNDESLLSHEFRDWVSKINLNKDIIIPDVVVAQDGSGDYRTVAEALYFAPNKSDHRYVIYVKQGTYEENVRVEKTKTNITLVGDGMYYTIITSSLNYIDGVPTFDSGTLIVEGDGFIGQDLWIMNTAGPEKHQAVALRVSADKTVINRCQIDAFQDTLYIHRDRQFYRDCTIKGTVDFIFGNAAVVLQNCTIVARRPMDGQSNMITAQSRSSPLQNTGISIQMSRIKPSKHLRPVQKLVKTYFGRPWKNYSTTVIMQSYIEGHIAPLGWAKWDDYTNTTSLYYGEYNNTGPGSFTGERVDWAGFHVINDSNVAINFTVGRLIKDSFWLNSTGVDYIDGLEIYSD
ncbi:pectinesterase-like [Silene latifolia]|uniref:pectinesterase-like n=1 Tax=Silene latifolia TaxID=37657 RepID=UPI003D787DA8